MRGLAFVGSLRAAKIAETLSMMVARGLNLGRPLHIEPEAREAIGLRARHSRVRGICVRNPNRSLPRREMLRARRIEQLSRVAGIVVTCYG